MITWLVATFKPSFYKEKMNSKNPILINEKKK